jgi:hypothetical protein
MNEEKNVSVNWDGVLGETDLIFGKFQRDILGLIKPFYDAAVVAQQNLEVIKKELEELKKQLEDK